MGFRYSFDEARGVLYLWRFGKVGLDEFRKSIEEIFSREEFARVGRILNDLSEGDFSSLQVPELTHYADFVKERIGDREIRVAIVAPSELSFGLARMFEVFSGIGNLEVFKTRQEALDWLGLESQAP